MWCDAHKGACDTALLFQEACLVSRRHAVQKALCGGFRQQIRPPFLLRVQGFRILEEVYVTVPRR